MCRSESIEVGERARQEFGDLLEMESSIKDMGLIQPLAVKQISEDKLTPGEGPGGGEPESRRYPNSPSMYKTKK